MKQVINVGVLGCGNISDIYLKNLTTLFRNVKVVGVCDVNDALAEEKSKTYNLPLRFHNYDEMLTDESVDVVLNLCPPLLHYELSKKALLAHKHVYSEKPLACEYAQARELVKLAADMGLQIGCSPDTVLGAAIQTCRRLIESGMIGDVVGCSANLVKRGIETWHPNPNFLFQRGAGPLMDMGPYYIGALLQLAGRISAVQGMGKITFPERVVTSQPHYGEIINVNVPTYINACLEFESGAIGSLLMTFDAYETHLPFLEIFGSEGTLCVPDPDHFGSAPILLYRPERSEWREMPFMFPYTKNSRGLGLSDLCSAIEQGRSSRASATAALHTVEVIEAIDKSCEIGLRIQLESGYSKPEPMPN